MSGSKYGWCETEELTEKAIGPNDQRNGNKDKQIYTINECAHVGKKIKWDRNLTARFQFSSEVMTRIGWSRAQEYIVEEKVRV